MLPTVPVTPRNVDDYVAAAGEQAVENLRRVAAPLAGARVLNLSSTAFGGGVAELLHTQVGLMVGLGIDATWQVIHGSDDFFTITKMVHNGLQGAEVPWTEHMQEIYLERCEANARELTGDFDFVIVHDPQPAGLLTILEDEGRRSGTWIWRCHIDLSFPHIPVWNFFADHVLAYDVAVLSSPDFVQPGLETLQKSIIPPSIDPLSLKNTWLGEDTIFDVLTRYGIDRSRPILTQVSRFDPWKDPIGVIDAYRLAKKEFPGLQLVLVGSMAHDDPEGWHYIEVTDGHRQGDPDIFLLTNLQEVGNLEVNAFQRASTIVIQKSLREGFGLVVSEGLWKEKPVIGGDAGGIRLQIEDGVNGFLVDSVDQCAERTVELLGDYERREKMGKVGRQSVRDRFLCIREVDDHLRMLASL
ncbi:MAG TPA: glycosyltransferase [Actinomycetota bacterium]|nr:glycosyltransferase [Actinomycetota bacterium]